MSIQQMIFAFNFPACMVCLYSDTIFGGSFCVFRNKLNVIFLSKIETEGVKIKRSFCLSIVKTAQISGREGSSNLGSLLFYFFQGVTLPAFNSRSRQT